MRTTLNAIILVVILAILTSCEGGNELDSMAPKAPESTTTTQKDSTQHQPTDPSRWTTLFGHDGQMSSTGWVKRFWLAAREDQKVDTIFANYQVKMELEDTIRHHFSGIELKWQGFERSLAPTGTEEYKESANHVFRAVEKTAWDIHCGAVTFPVNIERELARVQYAKWDLAFDLNEEYKFEAKVLRTDAYNDTIDNKYIYHFDVLDGEVAMQQGVDFYKKTFVVIVDRYIAEVEETTPTTPKANPMPSCLIVDGEPTFYGTITPTLVGGKLSGFDNIIIAQTSDSLYAVHAKKVVVKGSRSQYPRTKDQYGCYTAVQVDGVWKLAFVDYNHQKDDAKKAYVYAWGTGAKENLPVPVTEFVTGGAKNLDEKGKSYQNPFLRVVVSEPTSYDNGNTYQVQAYNYTKMVSNLVVGYFK